MRFCDPFAARRCNNSSVQRRWLWSVSRSGIIIGRTIGRDWGTPCKVGETIIFRFVFIGIATTHSYVFLLHLYVYVYSVYVFDPLHSTQPHRHRHMEFEFFVSFFFFFHNKFHAICRFPFVFNKIMKLCCRVVPLIALCSDVSSVIADTYYVYIQSHHLIHRTCYFIQRWLLLLLLLCTCVNVYKNASHLDGWMK